MELKQWAQAHNVWVTPDVCGDPIIPGKALQLECCHVFDFEDGAHFGLCLMLDHGRSWSAAKTKALAAAFTLKQDGDREGILLFDPANETQSELALSLAGIRQHRKHNLSAEQRATRSERMKNLARAKAA